MSRSTLKLLFLTGWWALIGLIAAQEKLDMMREIGLPLSAPETLLLSITSWLFWVPASLVIYWLVQRFPLGAKNVLTAVSVLSVGVAGVVLAKAMFVYAMSMMSTYWYPVIPSFQQVVFDSIRNNVLLAYLVIGAAHGFHFYEKSLDEAAKNTQLEVQVNRLRLKTLTAQLNPHFLFNTLNAISELISSDPDAADNMLIGLASLLRLSLEGSASQTVPLKEELSFADQYLDIQLARFRDRLDIHRAIDPKVMVCKVPFMLLQPLLENAIEHGVCRTLGPACITIRAQLDYDNLRIEIESPKPAFNKPTDGHGMGLSMTHARLATLYAGQYSLSLTPTDQQTMLVAVSFPASADVLDFDAFLSVPPREVAGVLHG